MQLKLPAALLSEVTTSYDKAFGPVYFNLRFEVPRDVPKDKFYNDLMGLCSSNKWFKVSIDGLMDEPSKDIKISIPIEKEAKLTRGCIFHKWEWDGQTDRDGTTYKCTKCGKNKYE